MVEKSKYSKRVADKGLHPIKFYKDGGYIDIGDHQAYYPLDINGTSKTHVIKYMKMVKSIVNRRANQQ